MLHVFAERVSNLLPPFLRATQCIKELFFFLKLLLVIVFIVFQFIAARQPGELFCTEL